MHGLASALLGLVMSAAPAGDPYRAELAQWREARAESLVRDDGWTALVGLHWLDPDAATTLGADADNDIVVASLPGRFGRFQFQDDAWFLQLEPGQTARRRGEDDQVLSGRIALLSDQAAAKAGVAPTRVQGASAHWVLIERGGRTGLRIWDAQAPSRTGFKGLTWFDADPAWRVEGRWVAHEPPRSIDIATVLNTVEAMANPGAVHFERDGKTFVLEALAEPGDEQLFLIFGDRSNRRQTYGAGRYLYAAGPDAEGRVILDFNRAYNPPCAYTAYATCPLPPPENRLDLAVTAGERRY